MSEESKRNWKQAINILKGKNYSNEKIAETLRISVIEVEELSK